MTRWQPSRRSTYPPGDAVALCARVTITLEAPVTDLIVRDSLYIDGAWGPSDGAETIDVENPPTEAVIGGVPSGTAGDVDRAVKAARAAFPAWAATDPEERSKHLSRLVAAATAQPRG